MTDKRLLCIIPARSGSKGIPDKNIRLFKEHPLMCWSIIQMQKSRFINQTRIVVSTDSKKYQEIAKQYGAETPFLRPAEISGDHSTDLEFMKHCLQWFQDNEPDYSPDVIVQLRPTQPMRKVEDLDKTIQLFLDNYDNYDSLRTVVPLEKSPFKMYTLNDEKTVLQPLFKEVNGLEEPYNQCRQVLPQAYLHNGYIDILKTELVFQDKLSGERIFPYVMSPEDTIDIDTEEDWKRGELS